MGTINAARLSQLLREMSRVPSQAAKKAAADLSREIQGNFDRGVDPFGAKWKRLAKSTLDSGRHPPPLTDTRRGRRSVKVKPMAGAGVAIVVGVLYMMYHQFGGSSHLRGPGGSYRKRKQNKHFGRDADRSSGRGNPPRRSFLPQGTEMPPRWVAIIDRAYRSAMQRVWRRG
jgi:phage gpG-like protein